MLSPCRWRTTVVLLLSAAVLVQVVVQEVDAAAAASKKKKLQHKQQQQVKDWRPFSSSSSSAVQVQQEDQRGVPQARCASRCLSLRRTRLHADAAAAAAAVSSKKHSIQQQQQQVLEVENNGSFGWCRNNKQCAKCLEPCKDTWEMKRTSQCRDLCERSFPKRQWECVTSCEFVQSAMTVKQGDCPAPERASGFAAACVESCDRDAECSAQKKCCSNGCGHTCQAPKNLYKGAPLKPRKELRFGELPSGQLEVSWSSRFNVSAEPVIYVLHRRWNYGIGPSEDSATPWQVVAQTTEPLARLVDTRPGRWYQFRVAAVNAHGTRGFTTPSRHVHTRRDPSAPPAPLDLRVTNMTFGPGRTVSARLLWSAPVDPDVPVHHYKVSWSWRAAGEKPLSSPSFSSTKRRKTLRGTQVELDSMRANRSYSVEVQAVSYWGQSQLKGSKAVLRFTTQQRTDPLLLDILDVGTPFYQDGQLQVRVYWQSSTEPSVVRYRLQWQPESCTHNHTSSPEKVITQELFASLRGLLFSCKYKVLLQPLGSKLRLPAESASFVTPPCAAIQSKSPKPIACNAQEAPPPPLKEAFLARVGNLSASFQVRGDNVTAAFSWEVQDERRPAAVTLAGYQVTWTEVTKTTTTTSPRNKQLPLHHHHSLISQSQILPPERTVLVVPGLRLGSLYRLEVQVIGAEGEGPASSRTFQTPGPAPDPPGPHVLTHTHLKHKSKLGKRHHAQPVIERH